MSTAIRNHRSRKREHNIYQVTLVFVKNIYIVISVTQNILTINRIILPIIVTEKRRNIRKDRRNFNSRRKFWNKILTTSSR
uniref:Uncharacterized protein n=1 Tax=Octopus bimaculoides TaxID=37653 RepID=A0A0L8IGZ4_OCTBM